MAGDIYITVKDVDHLGSGVNDNMTACGKTIPWGADWGYVDRESTTNPCPKCFQSVLATIAATAKPKAKEKAAV